MDHPLFNLTRLLLNLFGVTPYSLYEAPERAHAIHFTNIIHIPNDCVYVNSGVELMQDEGESLCKSDN